MLADLDLLFDRGYERSQRFPVHDDAFGQLRAEPKHLQGVAHLGVGLRMQRDRHGRSVRLRGRLRRLDGQADVPGVVLPYVHGGGNAVLPGYDRHGVRQAHGGQRSDSEVAGFRRVSALRAGSDLLQPGPHFGSVHADPGILHHQDGVQRVRERHLYRSGAGVGRVLQQLAQARVRRTGVHVGQQRYQRIGGGEVELEFFLFEPAQFDRSPGTRGFNQCHFSEFSLSWVSGVP